MHAIIQSVTQHLASGSTHCILEACPEVAAYYTAITTPYFTGKVETYLENAAAAKPRPMRGREAVWLPWSPAEVNKHYIPMQHLTEPVMLYPHLARPGVSICSCSS